MPTETPTPMPEELKTIHESPQAPDNKRPVPPPPPSPQPSREELRQQAARFLDASAVKNAAVEKKKEFLLEKGLTGAEVEVLLEELEKREQTGGEDEEVKVVGAKVEGEEVRKETADAATPNEKENGSGEEKGKEKAPPLITYPEFLTPAPAPPPPPLISPANMLKSAYLAAAVSSTIYGAHKFVFTPMYSALTEARSDLSATAIQNLTELNARLRELVPSTRPAAALPRRRRTSSSSSSSYGGDSGDGDDQGSSSSTSDPGEMFHVDATTQTTPSLDWAGDDEDVTPDGKLEHLSTQLHALVESHSDGMDNELTFALEDLRGYLEGLTYDWGGSSIFTSPYDYSGKAKDKDDLVAKVKAEIRSVKGVLLNTKNFPASR